MSGTQSGGLVPAVPPNLRIPLAYFTIGTGTAGTQYNQRALLIGASLIAQPAVPMLIASTAAAVAAFGRGSMLARMVAAYRANDPIGEIWCLPLPAAAVAATGGMTVAGAATAPGTLAIYAGGQAVPVAVAQGDTANTVLANAAAALTAALDQPVTAAAPAANATSVVLTARGLGTVAAGIDLRLNYYGASGAELTPPCPAPTGWSGRNVSA